MPVEGGFSAFARRHSLNAVTAVFFGLTFWRLGLASELLAVFAFIFGGVLLAVIDWKVKRLPTRLVYYTLAGVAAGQLLAAVLERDWRPPATAAAGAFLYSNAFALVYVLGRHVFGMMLVGFGDVRLALVLGSILGWYGIEWVLYGAALGNLLVLALAVATCFHQRKLVLRFSFGPSLIAGTWLALMIRG